MTKRNENNKVTAQEILDSLYQDETVTIRTLAKKHKVSRSTIRNRIRELRMDGNPIIHGSDGMRLLDKEEIDEPAVAIALATFTEWILSCIKAQIILSTPVKPLLPAMRRTLKENMSVDERRQLAKSCVTIRALLDGVEIEEELSES